MICNKKNRKMKTLTSTQLQYRKRKLIFHHTARSCGVLSTTITSNFTAKSPYFPTHKIKKNRIALMAGKFKFNKENAL